MRVRNNPLARQILPHHPFVVQNPKELRGKWQTLFPKPQPLYVELGSGKGQFLAKASVLHPDRNWLGVERVPAILLKAVRKAEEINPSNLRYLWIDVAELTEIFAEGELSRIYLHFSDPWPKKRHTKRRLTHPRFLEQYKQVLSQEGDLIFKTDNESFFDYSLEQFSENGWEVIELSRDLHNSPYRDGNITTEYEEKFSNQGMPIFYVRVKPHP